mmetsp:Transcript_17552/g.71036  ORF Transcript_17552/g.71036 Transcript_17552/m.71036 type:complete len:83 (+) Transcript_17552:1292-1540(+)
MNQSSRNFGIRSQTLIKHQEEDRIVTRTVDQLGVQRLRAYKLVWCGQCKGKQMTKENFEGFSIASEQEPHMVHKMTSLKNDF